MLRYSLCAMATIVFLSRFNPRDRRLSDGESDLKTKRFQLPCDSFFLERLQEHGLQTQFQESRRKRRQLPVAPSDRQARSHSMESSHICVLRPDMEFSGPLTCWGQECAYLWKACGCPADAFSLAIAKCIKLSHPVAIAAKRQQRGSLVWSPDLPLSAACLQGRVCSQFLEASQVFNAEDLPKVLGVAADQWQRFIAAPLCFSVPDVLVDLIERAAWSKLLSWIPGRGAQAAHRLCAELHFPSEIWLQGIRSSGRKGKLMPPACMPFGRQHARGVAEQLRQSAPMILDSLVVAEDRSAKRLELEQMVTRLDSFAQGFEQPVPHDRLDAKTLVSCLLSVSCHGLEEQGKLARHSEDRFRSSFSCLPSAG